MITRLTKGSIGDIKEVFRLFKEEGVREAIRILNSKKAPGLVQFAKYGICGVASVITLLVVAKIVIGMGFPVDQEKNPELTREAASRNLIIADSIAFVFANFTAYFLNVLWVFTPGRHSKLKEFTIFTSIAAFATVIGILAGPALVRLGLDWRLAQLSLVVTSALVNFVCRKFIVFQH